MNNEHGNEFVVLFQDSTFKRGKGSGDSYTDLLVVQSLFSVSQSNH